jgi:hypothetical protein
MGGEAGGSLVACQWAVDAREPCDASWVCTSSRRSRARGISVAQPRRARTGGQAGAGFGGLTQQLARAACARRRSATNLRPRGVAAALADGHHSALRSGQSIRCRLAQASSLRNCNTKRHHDETLRAMASIAPTTRLGAFVVSPPPIPAVSCGRSDLADASIAQLDSP